jgi:hypothetical protein
METYQGRVREWLYACFGAQIATDRIERGQRFLEEALELAQAGDIAAADAHQLVDYVYSRPQGLLFQEVGGVMTTLAALCRAYPNLYLHEAAETELNRVWRKLDETRDKCRCHSEPVAIC